jgi:aminoglycoside phosphotransferase (APT) family kinase protein
MLLITAGEERWILRRPPHTRSAATAHSVAREHRVLHALDVTDLPHLHALALCEDESVSGAPFMLMEFMEGIGATLPLPAPFDTSVEGQREIVFSLVDSLAQLSLVDWRAVGLEGFGKPDGFLARQVSRWRSQLEQYKSHHRATRRRRRVAQAGPTESVGNGIVHGDYQWNNVLFPAGRPGHVVAIVDWTQSTIGDPLLDIGRLLALWYDPGEQAPGARRAASSANCRGCRLAPSWRLGTPSAVAFRSSTSTTTAHWRCSSWRASSKAATPATSGVRATTPPTPRSSSSSRPDGAGLLDQPRRTALTTETRGSP